MNRPTEKQLRLGAADEMSWASIKDELLQCELYAPTDIDPRDVQFERRATIYRIMLIFMLFAMSVIAIEASLLKFNPVVVFLSFLTFVLNAVTFVRLVKTNKVLIPPVILLFLSFGVVMSAIALIGDYHMLWIFPLMVALVSLLPAVVALVCGSVAIGVMVLIRDIDLDAAALAIHSALIATWILSLTVTRLLTSHSDALADLALSDPLTGAYNRRYLLPQANRSLADYERYRRLSTLLVLDIDHFKRINDQYGHGLGDTVLVAMTDYISNRLRGVDMIFRLGGEEFVILLSDTGAQSASKVADDIREGIAELTILPEGHFTVSIGLCDVTVAASADDWLEAADKALYEAKQNGRNRVVSVPSKLDGVGTTTTLPVWR
jgi:diguanylate cyclase (GGDEF)-like protein